MRLSAKTQKPVTTSAGTPLRAERGRAQLGSAGPVSALEGPAWRLSDISDDTNDGRPGRSPSSGPGTGREMRFDSRKPSAIMPTPAPEHSQHHGGIAAHPLTRRKRVVGLDLGTSKVAAVVGETDDFGNINIIGVGEAPTEGLRKGVVVNIEKTVGSITAAVQAAERMAGGP